MGTGSSPWRSHADGAEPPPAVGPASGFRALFHAHVRYAWRSLLGLGVQERDVPDASQQVFLVVHDRFAAGRIEAAAMRTFIYGVCLRVAADYRRRAHHRHERLSAEPPERAVPPTQEHNVLRREALAALEAVLERLPAAQREAFVLYEIEELPIAEVARVLECPVQTAYWRLHAAQKAVLGAFAADVEEADSRSTQVKP